MLKEKKFESVEKLKKFFSEYKSVFIVHYHGLSVPQIMGLRAKMHVAGMKLIVTKNNLVRVALQDNEEFDKIKQYFVGPIAIAFSNDSVSNAKILSEFSKENEDLKLIVGSVDGSVVDKDGIKVLASLPSLDELRATIISIIQTPARSIVGMIAAPATKATRVILAYSEKQ